METLNTDTLQYICNTMSFLDFTSFSEAIGNNSLVFRGDHRWCRTLYELDTYIAKYGRVTDPCYLKGTRWCTRRHENTFSNENTWTEEQLAIIESTKDTTVVQAFAGTGKTSTLFEYANRRRDKKILYLAFNKELEQTAKQRARVDDLDVDVYTIHALALEYLKKKNIISENVNVGKIKTKDLERIGYDTSSAYDILQTLRTFCAGNSVDVVFNEHCQDNYKLYIFKEMHKVWNMMFKGALRMSHDVYLKRFQMMRVDLGYDIIMVDEIQDCTPCQMDIIYTQKCKKVLVGDIHQQIYNFRGVCNPFTDDALTLSKTFRFGFEIADLANMFLHIYKGETKVMKAPFEKRTIITTRIPRGCKYTIICRSNQGLLEMAMRLRNKKVFIMGKVPNIDKELDIMADFINISEGLYDMIKTEKLKGVAYRGTSFDAFADILLRAHKESSKWRMRVQMFKTHGSSLLQMYEELGKNIVESGEDADVIVTNVHQSKGLEFDTVVLGDDFSSICSNIGNTLRYKVMGTSREQYNLMYVAMTRARKTLVINQQVMLFVKKQNVWGHSVTSNIEEYVRCDVCGKNDTCRVRVVPGDGDDMSLIGYEIPVIYTRSLECDVCSNIS
jgi:F-box protein 18 (helicase)